MSMENKLVTIARRDNNTKRPYLLVNPLQGKHIPASPQAVLGLFQALAKQVTARYAKERLLIIGFAETATAIGAAVSSYIPNCAYYIHTTREALPQEEFSYFTEDHSHATQQKLAKRRLPELLTKTDRILFIEDEVTTGNTICNIIQILQAYAPQQQLHFGIASILNAMPTETIQWFREQDIACLYLEKLEQQDYTGHLNQFQFNRDNQFDYAGVEAHPLPQTQSIPGKADPRLGLKSQDYEASCQQLAQHIIAGLSLEKLHGATILVLGAEEFMYPALLFADRLECLCNGSKVWFHATTRSPILPCQQAGYPIQERFRLNSLYDMERISYIYNLTAYDVVFILHDANAPIPQGTASLVAALRAKGNNNIQMIQWSETNEKQL